MVRGRSAGFEWRRRTLWRFPTLTDGTVLVDVNAVALNGGTSLACSVVRVQADPNNGQNILIGNATSQSYVLTPGENELLWIDDAAKIYVRAVAGAQRVNWHVLGG